MSRGRQDCKDCRDLREELDFEVSQQYQDIIYCDQGQDIIQCQHCQEYDTLCILIKNKSDTRDRLNRLSPVELINMRSSELFIVAAECGNPESIKTLLDFGFDFNKVSRFSLTPLSHSFLNGGYITTMNYLVDLGAKMNVKGSWKVKMPNVLFYRSFCELKLKDLQKHFFSVHSMTYNKNHRNVVFENIEKFTGGCKLSLSCKTKIISKFRILK